MTNDILERPWQHKTRYYKIGFLLIVFIILLALKISAAVAMSVFGGSILANGLLRLIAIDWMNRHKILPKSAKK